MSDNITMNVYSSASTSTQQAVWNIDSVLMQPSYVSQRTVLDTEKVNGRQIVTKLDQVINSELKIHTDSLVINLLS